MAKLKDVHVEYGKDFEACKQYSGQFVCEPVMSVKSVFEEMLEKAEQSVQDQIPWSATHNGSLVVDTEELVKRGVFWDTVQEFKDFQEKYLCDSHKNYGKDCLFPEKYRKEGV